MRCTRCGTEAPPTDTDEPVEWAAREPDDEKVCCPECIIGAQQSTEPRPAPAGTADEGQVPGESASPRHTTARPHAHDVPVPRVPCRRLRPLPAGHGGQGQWLFGSRLQAGPDAGMTLDAVEEYLTYRTTHAEIMEYLNQAYGSAFVEDLIKHLPQLRAETLNLSQLRCRITASATLS